MSQTYSIYCKNCNQSLKVAKVGAGGATLFEKPQELEKLADFLYAHRNGCHLAFLDSVNLQMDLDEQTYEPEI